MSEEEIADYARWQDETTRWLHEKHKTDRASLLKDLQSETLSEQQRKQKKAHLESLEYILKSAREQKELEFPKGLMEKSLRLARHQSDAEQLGTNMARNFSRRTLALSA